MELEIKHCNNITAAKVSIELGKLNIKLAPNGTGKSTISKAIQFASTENQKALADLLPFKLRAHNPESITPEVIGIEHIASIMSFNEEYVSKFTFQADELVSNSFDIFIRTEAYKEKDRDIQALTSAVRQQFLNNPVLESLLANFKELSSAFKITANNGLAKTSTGAKALSSTNKIDHIPEGLELYQPFIQSPKSVNWIDWQTKGHKEFSDLSDSCPFCTSESADNKEKIAKVGREYDKNIIKNLVSIIDVINKLGDFFSDSARSKLEIIKSLKDGIEKEHEDFIVTIKSQIDNLVAKLDNLKGLTGFDFKEGENVGDKLPSYKIDLQFFETLNSVKTSETISIINQSIDDLTKQAGPLQGKINLQRIEMNKLIEKHQTDINAFLTFAGYRYQVEIVGDGEFSQLKLRHIDYLNYLSGGSQHLSFGERNAFSIILFMYECLAKKPSLIILDDPISSFDKNKKYAILEMLFRRNSEYCLKGKSVLMLTHDIEPIIDTLKSVQGAFSNQVTAAYLRLRNGEITEQRISRNDIKPFIKICSDVLVSTQDPIIKLIYLRRRYEVLGESEAAYQVLSNLFKKRIDPEDHRISNTEDGLSAPLSLNELSVGIGEIRLYISDLPEGYSTLVALFSNNDQIKTLYQRSTNGYEKLQLIRILLNIDTIDNSVIRKFINETYHIENEFIFQLDPTKFDLIPEYIVTECDKILETL
jgi:energy-coupling factor transporter ATP-binding protein EcfA2